MDYPSLDRIAALQQLIANFGSVERALNLPGTKRRENDNDHSFGLALTCWYLQPMIAPNLNLLEIFKYSLTHDLVELHAGDTFAFDKAGMEGKMDRERVAVDLLRKEWIDFIELSDYAEGYMNRESDEAKFVKAVDKLLPPIMIELSGKSEWGRLGITLEAERENKKSLYVSEYLKPYYDLLLEWLDSRGNIPK
ncbi:MAG: HD domain-containing protein [Patescibacteria group bacterium]